MDSLENSGDSYRIKPYDSPDLHKNHLRSRFNNNNKHLQIPNNNGHHNGSSRSLSHDEQKDPEQHQDDIVQPHEDDINIENDMNDNNKPFHLSYHHLQSNNKLNPNQENDTHPPMISGHGDNDNDTKNSASSQTPSSSSQNSSYNNQGMHAFDHHRFNPHIYMMHNQPILTRNNHSKSGSIRSRNSVQTDNLQRRLQKLEQDLLSKNIQHDIMVNKEEMMAKRLKTKDIRIKNLQNDIIKLRDQLASKQENQDKLVNEMHDIQQQNHGLKQKLQESGIGIDLTNLSDLNNENYNESMRDILRNLQQNLAVLTNDVNHIKQNQNTNNSEYVHHQNVNIDQDEISNTVQSCIAPVVDSMKEQQRDFMNALQNEQNEWISSISEQIKSHQDILETNYNSMEQKIEMNEKIQGQNIENQFNLLQNKLTEMDKNNKQKMIEITRDIKKNETKLSCLNNKYFQQFFDSSNRTRKQSQELIINQLKQDIKREIYELKTEINSNIKKSKNEIDSNITTITQNIINSNNDLKYQIQNALINNKQKTNTERQQMLSMNINHNKDQQIMEQCQRLIESQSDILTENTKKLQCIERENCKIIDVIRQNGTTQSNKLYQISEENSTKITTAIEGLKPLFSKLYEYFQGKDTEMVQTIQTNNTDMIQSFAQHKHQLQKIIEDLVSQNSSYIESMGTPAKYKGDEYSTILREMRSMKSFMNDLKSVNNGNKNNEYKLEMNAMTNNMKQLAKQHEEVIRLITNTIPTTMDKLKVDSNKLNEAISSLQTWQTLTTHQKRAPPSPKKNIIQSQNINNDEMVNIMKNMIMQQINEMKQGFNKVTQQINTSNVSLFNNIKGVQNNYKSEIVDLCSQNNKSVMKAHESVLKGHLQQIASKLSELNQSQLTVNMALQQIPQNMIDTMNKSQISLSPKPSDSKQQAASNQGRSGNNTANIQQAINQSNARLMHLLQTHIDKKVNEIKLWVDQNRRRRDDGDSSNGSDAGGNGNGNGNGVPSKATKKVLETVNELKEFLKGDMVKEIQRITNFVREIHGKVDQLPHKMAFKKDVLQIEQNVHKMLSQTQASILQTVSSPKPKQRSTATETVPITSNISPTQAKDNQMMNILNQSMTSGFHELSGLGNGNQMERSPGAQNNLMTDMIDQIMGVMMMKFDHWLQEIEAGIQSNTFNIYTIIYILSTIVFTRFYQHWTSPPQSNGDRRERKSMEMEEEEQKGNYNMDRYQAELIKKIQKMKVDAMNLLNRIEMELANDELDEVTILNEFGAFISEYKTGIDSLWIPSQGERIEYKFKAEMRMIKKISNVEEKLNRERSICDKSCIFGICGVSIMFGIGFIAMIVAILLNAKNTFY